MTLIGNSASFDVTRYHLAHQRGIDWLLHFWETEHYQVKDIILEGCYKSPMSLFVGEKISEGQLVLQAVIDKYLNKKGHFEDDLSLSPNRHCDLYQDFWLIWGSYYLCNYDIVEKCMAFAFQSFNESLNGFQSNIQSQNSEAQYDLRSTALGGLICLHTQHLDVAESCGEYIIRLLNLQPDILRGFYLIRNVEGKLISDFRPEDERFFLISRNQVQPLYYALGLAVSFLANLFVATNQKKFLLTAEQYFEVCERFAPNIYQHYYSGKLGWGLAQLYKITRKDIYGRLATKIADHLISMQLSTGAWYINGLFSDFKMQPLATTIDRTAEYSIWLKLMADELSSLSS
jgi:hypothetical protein